MVFYMVWYHSYGDSCHTCGRYGAVGQGVVKPSSAALAEVRRQTAEGRVRQTERKKAAAAASGGLAEDEGEEGRAIGDVEMTEESEGEEPVREGSRRQ